MPSRELNSSMAANKDDQLGILQRRRIEANIISPIYEILVRDLGKERAAQIIEEAITLDARKAGARFAEAEPAGASLKTFIGIQELWKKDDALITETTTETETEFSFKVHKCAYAQMYREMGLAEIGKLLSCTRDYEFIAGYDPSIELERTQTVMEGAPYCDFHYRKMTENP